jgi:hypothetical protein
LYCGERCDVVALRYTRGFIDHAMLLWKFHKHVTLGREFTYATRDDYETNADRFLGEPKDTNTEEYVKIKKDGTRGDKLRYNRVTQEFGILGSDGVIRSYYKPNPARHGKGTNYDYYLDCCSEQRD